MPVKGQEQVIFKKVAMSEKKMIFRELASEKMQIMLKGTEREEPFYLVANQVEKDENLLCQHTASSSGISKDQKVSGNFSFRNERYYFHSEISFQNGWTVLKINVDIFQLQRRANARINLPDNYDGVFVLTSHMGKAYFIDCKLKDVSAGGFKMEMPGETPALKIGDTVKGTLRLGKRRPMDFDLEVRFAKKSQEGDNVVQVAGLQFLNRDHAIENRLLLMMMDIQRELYLKYSDRKKAF